MLQFFHIKWYSRLTIGKPRVDQESITFITNIYYNTEILLQNINVQSVPTLRILHI